jgi:hypothetical protein
VLVLGAGVGVVLLELLQENNTMVNTSNERSLMILVFMIVVVYS